MRFLRLILIASLIFVYSACKKNSSVDLTPSFYFLNGDTSSFSNTLILFTSSDTITYNAIVSSTYLLPRNVNVTLGVVSDSLASYNASHGTDYQLMPANAYSFQTQYNASDSSVFDTVHVSIYKHALDASKSYMLPIGITDAGGIAIDAGTSTIYLHTTSSVLSGIYNSTGIKTLYTADSVTSVDTFEITKSLIPVTATESDIDYADLGSNGWKYKLYFYLSNGTPVFEVNPNDVIATSV
ncbi:MAG TPA: DUF1735 domain-containing protein, partial [Parafilimonas sp.]|nr:DUF1735 domain-containing protein [Parafilimonas sp.]